MKSNVPGCGRRARALALGLWLVAAAAAPAGALADPHDVVESLPSGKINWSTGWVRATGVGVPPPTAGGAAARAAAERAAFAVALRNLLETVKGVRVDSLTLVENYMVTSDVIKTQISGFVKGAQVDTMTAQPDGSVELSVKLPLWGAESLIAPLMGAKDVQGRHAPDDASSEEGFTGVVVDARGVGVKPACFPELIDEATGEIVYGPSTVDRTEATREGMAHYVSVPPGSDLSSAIEWSNLRRPVQRLAQASGLPRVGRRPLRIKGLNKAGSLQANILISHDDAERIRRDRQISGALRRSKVVIVTDPMVGGIEGAVPEEHPFMAARPFP